MTVTNKDIHELLSRACPDVSYPALEEILNKLDIYQKEDFYTVLEAMYDGGIWQHKFKDEFQYTKDDVDKSYTEGYDDGVYEAGGYKKEDVDDAYSSGYEDGKIAGIISHSNEE